MTDSVELAKPIPEEGDREPTYGVCLCPSCFFPLHTDKMGVEEEEELRCGLCKWEGKSGEAKVVPIAVWRQYVLDPESVPSIPPLPRGIFFSTLYEQVGAITGNLGLFLAKWGLLSSDDLRATWFPVVARAAATEFVQAVLKGVNDPPVEEEEPQEEDN